MKKVLITGSCGFLGTNCALKFLANGWGVIGLDNLHRRGVHSNILSHPSYQFAHADVRNYSDLKDINDKEIEVILHLAANPGIPWSIKNPRYDFEVNAGGTINILEYARIRGTKVIFASTNKVYSDAICDIPLEEKDYRYDFKDEKYKTGITTDFPMDGKGLNPHSPYGCSKASADLYCQEYFHTYGVPTTVFRMSCLTKDSNILTYDGWKNILSIKDNEMVASYDGKKVVWDKVKKVFQTDNKNKRILHITTKRGRQIKITNNHLVVTPSGWRQIGDLSFGSLIATTSGYKTRGKSGSLEINEDKIREILSKFNFSRKELIDKKVSELKSLGLLPFNSQNPYYHQILEFVGYCFGDANFSINKKKNRQALLPQLQVYGYKEDLENIKTLLSKIGIKHGDIKTTYSRSELVGGKMIAGNSLKFVIGESGFLTLMLALQIPVGDKVLQDFDIPDYLETEDEKISFLRGIFGAELSNYYYTKDKACFGQLKFFQSKAKTLPNGGVRFIKDIQQLVESLGIKTCKTILGSETIRKSGVITQSIGFHIYAKKENILNFAEKIGYAFCEKRIKRMNQYVEFHNDSYKNYDEWLSHREHGIEKSGMLWDEILDIQELPIDNLYDIETEKNHNFFADGILVHNCLGGKYQLGADEQGWFSWFMIAKLLHKPLTIYGNGKQVRDVLYGDDIAELYYLATTNPEFVGKVFNVGGGPENTVSLLEAIELIDKIDKEFGFGNPPLQFSFADWRLADHRVYYSDIRPLEKLWKPKNGILASFSKTYEWLNKNKDELRRFYD